MSSIRPSAAVLLSRPGGKVWLGQRGRTRFLPGFWVFPGGGCDPGESAEAAARRELEEETTLRLSTPFRPLSRAVTPEFAPVRYDCYVYCAEVPDELEPRVDDEELVRGRWFAIEELLRMSDLGELQLAPPTYRQLRLFQEIEGGRRPYPSEREAFATPPVCDQAVLPMADGVTVIPLRSPSLPPAGWTNAVIVGKRRLLVVDPGGPEPELLLAELQARLASGAEIAGVLLTHHHPDHLTGYLSLQLTEAPLYCHRLTAPLLPDGFPEPRLCEDQQVLEFEEGLSVVCHWTPGHAPGHLALEIPQRKTLLAADLISSLSSIVIPTSNGDLIQYLESLARMRDLDCHLVIPAHGPSYGQGSDPFGLAIAHRKQREQQVERCLQGAGEVSLSALTKLVYRGLDQRLVPAAEANLWHHLRKLASEGRAQESDSLWRSLEA